MSNTTQATQPGSGGGADGAKQPAKLHSKRKADTPVDQGSAEAPESTTGLSLHVGGEKASKQVRLTTSKILGVAPYHKPRIGPEYQAIIPPVQGAARARHTVCAGPPQELAQQEQEQAQQLECQQPV